VFYSEDRLYNHRRESLVIRLPAMTRLERCTLWNTLTFVRIIIPLLMPNHRLKQTRAIHYILEVHYKGNNDITWSARRKGCSSGFSVLRLKTEHGVEQRWYWTKKTARSRLWCDIHHCRPQELGEWWNFDLHYTLELVLGPELLLKECNSILGLL
jgi:hypothetical protein